VTIWIATGLGCGYAKWMPGTVGALWGLPLTWSISRLPSFSLQVVVITGLIFVGVPICTATSRYLGRKDPSCVVWDEIATMPLVFLGMSEDAMSHASVYLSGFVLHRIFDITKPPPILQSERLPEGWGIMADDCIAACYACGALHWMYWLVTRS
jgi:phosphatidylglycerophosphatase A